MILPATTTLGRTATLALSCPTRRMLARARTGPLPAPVATHLAGFGTTGFANAGLGIAGFGTTGFGTTGLGAAAIRSPARAAVTTRARRRATWSLACPRPLLRAGP